MKKAVMLAALLLLMPVVYAQLDWSITDLRCGDGVLDKYELCEKGIPKNESRCEMMGEKLGIAMACFEKHCTCLPKINPVYCGNNRRDLNEMCDGNSADDKCPVLAETMGNNVTLKCNTKTCGCDIVTIETDYSPKVIEAFKNATQTASVCGNKKVERDEDCDPPNTLCTTATKDPGVCTQKCRCVRPEQLGEEEATPEPTVAPSENATTGNVTLAVEKTPVPEKKVEEPGIFARFWDWLISLFS